MATVTEEFDPTVCPECRARKCDNCTHQSMTMEDRYVRCSCEQHGHPRRQGGDG